MRVIVCAGDHPPVAAYRGRVRWAGAPGGGAQGQATGGDEELGCRAFQRGSSELKHVLPPCGLCGAVGQHPIVLRRSSLCLGPAAKAGLWLAVLTHSPFVCLVSVSNCQWRCHLPDVGPRIACLLRALLTTRPILPSTLPGDVHQRGGPNVGARPPGVAHDALVMRAVVQLSSLPRAKRSSVGAVRERHCGAARPLC